jgi:hypothetical protein
LPPDGIPLARPLFWLVDRRLPERRKARGKLKFRHRMHRNRTARWGNSGPGPYRRPDPLAAKRGGTARPAQPAQTYRADPCASGACQPTRRVATVSARWSERFFRSLVTVSTASSSHCELEWRKHGSLAKQHQQSRASDRKIDQRLPSRPRFAAEGAKRGGREPLAPIGRPFACRVVHCLSGTVRARPGTRDSDTA